MHKKAKNGWPSQARTMVGQAHKVIPTILFYQFDALRADYLIDNFNLEFNGLPNQILTLNKGTDIKGTCL